MNLALTAAEWSFRDATAGSPWRPAGVPGCVHRDLHRLGLIPDPFFAANELGLRWIEERDWEYRCRFDVPADLLAEEIVELVSDGLDTVATVTLNDRVAAHTDNMFVAHRWPVRRGLRPGRNELRILFSSAARYVRTHRPGHRPRDLSDSVGGMTRLRKQQCQFGWDWGPRFVTCGIWRDLRLEAWTGNRLANVRVAQHHRANGAVELELFPELARSDRGVTYYITLGSDGRTVAEGQGPGLRIKVPHPQLWWPAGQGAQPLYTTELVARDAVGREIGRWRRRIGLRTVELERKADRAGESFRFVVNGRPIFAKGANWIPAHAFVAGLTRADYARDLRSAAAAHMNMIRVWGGGVYESEDFYDLCDELGLLVWQDFMFACTRYPADRAFRASVQAEAEQQVRRLHHRACLALWCGNNEIAQLNPELAKRGRARREYDALFHRVLPDAVAAHDGATAYWPSSPWRGHDDHLPAAGERAGDTHFWDVWHARKPAQEYERWRFRFVSEFGMQSYSSPETNATFCPPDEANVFGPAMENHQKNPAGNQLILDYVSRRYRLPKSQADLIWLSQLNQAHCMQVAVEHWRRNWPHCAGALYWQLNDCWPVASWSSLEFGGRWKALHHAARRFFAPLLVTARVDGEETAGLGNYRRSTVRFVHLHTVCDRPQGARGRLRWELWHMDGRVLRRGTKAVRLRPGEARRWLTLDLGPDLARHGAANLHLRIALEADGAVVSEDSVLLTAPRFLNLPRAPRTHMTVRRLAPARVRLTFRSAVFQHRFAFALPGVEHTAGDNWFELFPGKPKSVVVDFAATQTLAAVRRALRWRSLADTYE